MCVDKVWTTFFIAVLYGKCIYLGFVPLNTWFYEERSQK